MQKAFQEITKATKFLVPTVAFGVGFGLFLNGYLLADIFPVDSTRLLFFTVLAGLSGSVAFFFLTRWLSVQFFSLPRLQRWGLFLWSILLGLFLLFAGTDQWRSATRYVTLFLPVHNLKVSVTSASASNQTALLWFNTSLGDVSYDTISLRGWKRRGDRILLDAPAGNALSWKGVTGEEVQLVFQDFQQSGEAAIWWDGVPEYLSLTPGKVVYTHQLKIPWYASYAFVLFLGIFNFIFLAFALTLVVWARRSELLKALEETVSHSEGWSAREVAILLGIVALALWLRVANLDNLFPAVDEYYHLIAARQILEGAALSSVYQRSLWVVTIPVSTAMGIFGEKIAVARAVGAVVNVLAIFPLYLLTRRINRPVASLSAFLYATSPWIIVFARVTREYAYFPFFFLWIVYGMILFIQEFPDHFILYHDWKDLLRPQVMLLSAALLIPLYAAYQDPSSTFKVIRIAYVVFALFVLLKFDRSSRVNLLLLALMAAGVLFYAWSEVHQRLGMASLQFNTLPIEYFFSNPQQQWYFDRWGVIAGIGLITAFLLSFMLRRVNLVPLFILALYGSFLMAFVFFVKGFFHTRHLSTTELWFIILYAIGAYAVWRLACILIPLRGVLVGPALALVLLVLSFNVQQTLLPVVSTDPDVQISEDYHHNMSLVDEYMRQHAVPGDALAATVYGLYASWQEYPEFRAMYRFTTQTSSEELSSFVDNYSSGWIVIDQIRFDKMSMSVRKFLGGNNIKYIGQFGDENVWHWQHSLENTDVQP